MSVTRLVNTRKPARIPTGDREVDRAFDGLIQSIDEQRTALDWVVVSATLANGVTTRVAHKLGRMPKAMPMPSVIAGASSSGRIDFVSMNENEFKVEANGYGATITVDFLVV